MPFDSTTFRQPTVTVLPPTPPDVTAQNPDRGGGPTRRLERHAGPDQ